MVALGVEVPGTAGTLWPHCSIPFDTELLLLLIVSRCSIRIELELDAHRPEKRLYSANYKCYLVVFLCLNRNFDYNLS